MGESGNITRPVTDNIQLPVAPHSAAPLVEVEVEAKAKAKAQAPSRGSSMKILVRNHEDWLKKKRGSLMIVATVIVAMAYQAGLNPPSGVWQKDDDKDAFDYLAGTFIMAYNYPKEYPRFMAYNTVSFVASLSIIFMLISGLPIKRGIFMWLLMVVMWITITFMALTYLTSLQAVAPDHVFIPITREVDISLLVWLVLIGIVMLAHTIRFLIWCVRKRQLRKKKKPSILA